MIDSWLNEKGEVIEVGFAMHNDYASTLLKKEMGLKKLLAYMRDNNINCPYEVLHKRGWIRVKYNTAYLPKIQILGDCCDLTKMARNTIDPPMNSKQMRVAKRLCYECNTSFHVAINDKRFW